MGDLRKVLLSKLGLSVFWPNIWYGSNSHYSGEITKIKLYDELFRYIFFWGFSFSPFFSLKHIFYYLDNSNFIKLSRPNYFKFKKKVVKSSRGNFLSKISALNYYNFIILVFYVYLPSKYKDRSKAKKIFRLKLFNSSLLSNFKLIVQINTLGVISLINKHVFFKFNYLNLRKSFDVFLLIQNKYFYFFINLLKFNSFFYNNFLVEMTGFEVKKFVTKNSAVNSRVVNMVYVFYFHLLNLQIFCSVLTSQTSLVPSISSLYLNANWAEREFAEMFGVVFKGKNDSRKLLLDYSFVGFPLLKTFSLTGYFELFFNLNLFWVFYTPIKYKHGYEYYTFYNF